MKKPKPIDWSKPRHKEQAMINILEHLMELKVPSHNAIEILSQAIILVSEGRDTDFNFDKE